MSRSLASAATGRPDGRKAISASVGRQSRNVVGRRARRHRPHSCTRRSRRALPMTDTELKVIAALAIIGLSSRPKNG